VVGVPEEFELSGPELTLENLIALYTESGDLVSAVDMAEVKTYTLMRRYPEGVPSGVMFAGNTKSVIWLTELLAAMIVEMTAKIEKWSKETEEEQAAISLIVLRLLRAHALNVTLYEYMPTSER